MFDRIHHAGLAVADLAAVKTLFADGLGLVFDAMGSPLPHGHKQRSADPTVTGGCLDRSVQPGTCNVEAEATPSIGT